jgi:uncharacterized protein YjbI with pentapeptide repeats
MVASGAMNRLPDTDLRGAEIGGADLRGAWLREVDLSGAHIRGARRFSSRGKALGQARASEGTSSS